MWASTVKVDHIPTQSAKMGTSTTIDFIPTPSLLHPTYDSLCLKCYSSVIYYLT